MCECVRGLMNNNVSKNKHSRAVNAYPQEQHNEHSSTRVSSRCGLCFMSDITK